MKTLIVILVLFCSISAKAEKLEGLFGVKIGEILTKELIIHPPPSIGFNYDVFLDIVRHLCLTMSKKHQN